MILIIIITFGIINKNLYSGPRRNKGQIIPKHRLYSRPPATHPLSGFSGSTRRYGSGKGTGLVAQEIAAKCEDYYVDFAAREICVFQEMSGNGLLHAIVMFLMCGIISIQVIEIILLIHIQIYKKIDKYVAKLIYQKDIQMDTNRKDAIHLVRECCGQVDYQPYETLYCIDIGMIAFST